MVKRKSQETRVIHEGELANPEIGNIHTPLFGDSVFIYPNKKSKIIDKYRDLPFIYSRLGNPTVQSLEEKYASVENAESALAFSSGMSAISTTILTILKPGDRLLTVFGLYGQTLDLLQNDISKLGIKVDFMDIDRINSIEFDTKKYKAVFVESIINPTLEVTDLKKLSREAPNAIKIVDASMASPVNQNPLELGFDLVIHSATKYISGMDDVVGGLIAGSKDLIREIAAKRKALGTIMDPYTAHVLSKNIKTMYLRVNKQNDSAFFIANKMEKMGIKVNYPGLKNKYYGIAKDNLRGFGGVISFDLGVDYEKSQKFMDRLEIIKKAPTFGGVESLITLPWETSHTYITPEHRKKIGITESLLRLSVGIEDKFDIFNDLKNSLKKIK